MATAQFAAKEKKHASGKKISYLPNAKILLTFNHPFSQMKFLYDFPLLLLTECCFGWQRAISVISISGT